MSRITWPTIVVPFLTLALLVTWRTEALADAQISIVALEAKFTDAVKAEDPDKTMSYCVNSDDLVVFNLTPPRQ